VAGWSRAGGVVKKFFIAFCLLLGLAVNSAQAGDASVRWDGVYLGLHAGGMWVNDQLSDDVAPIADTIRSQGFVAGGLLGINFQHGNFVTGFELDASKAWGTSKAGAFGDSSELVWNTHLRMRAGVVIDRSLYFLAGGIAMAKFDQRLIGFKSQKEYYYGVTAGLGVETFMAPDWIWRAEYLFTHYSAEDNTFSSFFFPEQVRHRNDTHELRLALIRKFGGPTPPKSTTSSGRYDWTGYYAGIHAGYMQLEDQTAIPGIISDSGTMRGFIGGALAGANFQNGNWVAGFEFDFGVTNAERNGLIGGLLDASLIWNAHFRGRLGYASGNQLAYVAAGLALAQMRLYSEAFFEGPARLHVGYTLGAGLDTLIAQNWVFRVEYLFSDYGGNSYLYHAPVLTVDADPSSHIVRAALIYNIGNPGTPADGARATAGSRDWSGWYTGFHGGGVWMRGALDVVAFDFSQAVDLGANAGLLAGFNYQRGNWVFGLEADLGKFLSTGGPSGNVFGPGIVNVDALWDGHIRSRIGYASGNQLAFLAAGVAAARFEQTVPIDGTKARTHFGFTAGTGLDAMVGNWIMRTEYLYSSYGVQTYDYTGTGGGIIDSRHETHTVRAAAIVKLN
jgi:outer membrane immunogenic protein